MDKTYDKLASRIRENVLVSLPGGEQYWVAIAGGPGSGMYESVVKGETCLILDPTNFQHCLFPL